MLVAPTVSAVAETFICVPVCSRWNTARPAVNTRQSTEYVKVCRAGKAYPGSGACSTGITTGAEGLPNPRSCASAAGAPTSAHSNPMKAIHLTHTTSSKRLTKSNHRDMNFVSSAARPSISLEDVTFGKTYAGVAGRLMMRMQKHKPQGQHEVDRAGPHSSIVLAVVQVTLPRKHAVRSRASRARTGHRA